MDQSIKVSALYNLFSGVQTGELLSLEWNQIEGEIHGFSPVETSSAGDLIFVDRPAFARIALEREFACIVTNAEIYRNEIEQREVPALITENVSLAHALIRQRLDDRNPLQEEWNGIHESAVVHETAVIPDSAMVGPGAVVGAGVVLGEKVAIMARSVVEHGSVIGDESVVHPGVVIGYHTIIGKSVVIKAGAVIGSEGFGFAQDSRRTSHRIPQTGRVRIEDDVVIGSGCCIDRATYGETSIGRGTKLDNLCHIAHNVEIGEDCLLTAGFIVAGSTKIGDRMIASGQTGILDHLKISDDVVLLHRAGVTDNIDKPGAYAGLPLQPLNQYLKNQVMMKKLNSLRKQIRDMEKAIEKSGED